MRSSISLFFSLFLLLGLAGCGTTDSSVKQAPTVGAGGVNTQKFNNDLIRTGDGLAVRISGVPANEQGIYEVRVDESGNITMPYINNVPAAGITTVELKQRIENAYRDKGIFPTSNIQIYTKEVRLVVISGEVRSPQRLPYSNDLTVTGAIAACGGFTEYANKRRIRILRNGQVMETNALEIMKNPSLDVQLLPNDTIQVDRAIF